jgi:hypothetical protein
VRSFLAFLLLLALLPPAAPAHAQDAAPPVVGGIALERTTTADVPLFYDPDVDAATVATASTAIADALRDVPEITGLPPFATPIRAYILADEERFRRALAEIADVRVELVSEDIGGYTIERDGTMLVFFAAANVSSPASAALGYTHEFAHLAVREATRRKTLPQWFNEVYASLVAFRAVFRRHQDEASLQRQLDRAAVASALHTRGLIPWADLVTRARFSRAGVDGLANLAYGQSMLFVEHLELRHGRAGLVQFLTALGEGTTATPAFAAAFGPFRSETAAFEQEIAWLKGDFPPGMRALQPAGPDRPAVFALVGGPALETATVELLENGELSRRRQLDLDGAGFLVVSLPASLLDGSAPMLLRVTVPILGAVEIDPVAGTSARPASPTVPAAPRPAPAPAPAQAPVQLPPVG